MDPVKVSANSEMIAEVKTKIIMDHSRWDRMAREAPKNRAMFSMS
jgi:hypothetical protein